LARFGFETAVHGTLAIVALRGELDLLATPALEPELERLADEPGGDSLAPLLLVGPGAPTYNP